MTAEEIAGKLYTIVDIGFMKGESGTRITTAISDIVHCYGEQVRAEQREADAKVAESMTDDYMSLACEDVAARIRAGGAT